MFCGHSASSMNMLYREFACDAVLCPPGTFNIHGHATLHSACQICPPSALGNEHDYSIFYGRPECETAPFIHGDLNADGILSPREVLRMIYVDTLGRFWGPSYQSWADMSVHECKLAGITCSNGHIIRLDLSNAEMCSNGESRRGPKQYCKGLPSEIGTLTTLESLHITHRQFLRGTIPTEVGKLTMLTTFDVSGCSLLSGTIPTEVGTLTNLRHFDVSSCRLSGSIPRSILSLTDLEKLHLTHNYLVGSLPTEIGQLKHLKEFMVSRNKLIGTIPTQVGLMLKLENIEVYLNALSGNIPAELAIPTIKRIGTFKEKMFQYWFTENENISSYLFLSLCFILSDACGNQLVGTIPSSIARVKALQILHLKDNQLTGTIPSEFGDLPYLSWFDVSQNYISGTIPSSFGSCVTLEDFRISDNYIYGTIPDGLCHNSNVNDGTTQVHECHGIACPQGYYASSGHATLNQSCEKCPIGTSNMFLGSTYCEEYTDHDILSILFEVLQGHDWPSESKVNWGNHGISLCEWAGIDCDANGEVISLGFPLPYIED
jgi:Leucine-rich repeat (LRR) protein